MIVASHFRLTRDPFSPIVDPADAFDSRSHRTGCERISELLGSRTPLIAIIGEAGSGKTMLLRTIERCCATDGVDVRRLERCCAADGVDVRRLERSDLATGSSGDGCDLLLIDEADKINGDTLEALAAGAGRPQIVLASLRPCADRLSHPAPVPTIELTRLDRVEAARYLIDRVERAGAADLFTPEALGVIVEAAGGSIQLLRLLGSNALFQAALDNAPRIEAAHAHQAAAMHEGPKHLSRGDARLRAPEPIILPEKNAQASAEQAQRAETETDRAAELLLLTPIPEDDVLLLDSALSDGHPTAVDAGSSQEADRKTVTPVRSRGLVPAIVAGEISIAVIACLLIWFAETGPSYAPDTAPPPGSSINRDPPPIALDPFGIVAKEPSAVVEPVKQAAVEQPPSLPAIAASSKDAPKPAPVPVQTAGRADRPDEASRPQPRSLVANVSPEPYAPPSRAQTPSATAPRTVVPRTVIVATVPAEIGAVDPGVPAVVAGNADDGAAPTAAIDPAIVLEAEAAREQARVIREAARAARDSVRFARMGRGGG